MSRSDDGRGLHFYTEKAELYRKKMALIKKNPNYGRALFGLPPKEKTK